MSFVSIASRYIIARNQEKLFASFRFDIFCCHGRGARSEATREHRINNNAIVHGAVYNNFPPDDYSLNDDHMKAEISLAIISSVLFIGFE